MTDAFVFPLHYLVPISLQYVLAMNFVNAIGFYISCSYQAPY